MKKSNRRLKKTLLWLTGIILLAPILFFSIALGLVLHFQDTIRAAAIDEINKNFNGLLIVEESHLDVWEDFPRISLDLERVKFYEGKEAVGEPLYAVEHMFLGIDLFGLLKKEFHVKSLHLKNGHLNLVQDENGELNILRAKGFYEESEAETQTEESQTNSPFFLEFKEIHLDNFNVKKHNLLTDQRVNVDIKKVRARFKLKNQHVYIKLLADFYLSVINESDKVLFNNKHIVFEGKLDFDQKKELLDIQKANVALQDATFGMSGNIDVRNNMDLDLSLFGNKSDFNLILAFLPEETAALIKRYKNRGEIYFNATVKGKSANGNSPAIEAEFGCAQAWFLNTQKDKQVDELSFKGYFSNGEDRNLSTSVFKLLDFNARPGTGAFKGSVIIRNFEDPYVDMNLFADLDLSFIGEFLGLEDFQGIKGKVTASLSFDELMDLDVPELSLGRLKEGVDSEIRIQDLSFTLPQLAFPVRKFNLLAEMRGGEISLSNLSFEYGHSDFKLSGSLDDFPALFHHQKKPITIKMEVESQKLVFRELLAFNPELANRTKEVVTNLRFKAHFETSVSALENASPLPLGEFFIDEFYAKFKYYPHAFHDMEADIIIDEDELFVKSFSCEIDNSDFNLHGSIKNYRKWFEPVKKGTSVFDLNLKANQIRFRDLLSYDGENHMPEEYRDEVLREFSLNANLILTYDSILKATDLVISNGSGKLNVHPLKLERVSGRIHWEKDNLLVEKLKVKLGPNDMTINLSYYNGKDPKLQRQLNHFYLDAPYMDLDGLMSYQLPSAGQKEAQPAKDHDAGFNIFEVPFKDITLLLDIGLLKYHSMQIKKLHTFIRMKENHVLYLDTFNIGVAGGDLALSGYMDGRNPKDLYMKANLILNNIVIEEVFVKLDGMGQDITLGDNIKGRVSGSVNSKFRLHTDLTPILDSGEAEIAIQILEGAIVKFAPITAMARFFKDKNLNLVRFDTLQNTFTLKNGTMSFPNMRINSTLGFIEVSGKQTIGGEMEYYVRVPWKLVGQAGRQALFGGKKESEIDENQEDEIQRADPSKRVRFLNLAITGTTENFSVKPGRDKKPGR
jgi:hypothetical protein